MIIGKITPAAKAFKFLDQVVDTEYPILCETIHPQASSRILVDGASPSS